MTPHIVITIQDSNRYFALGIQHILQDYFLAKGCTWSFVPVAPGIAIDLMICVNPFGWSSRFNSRREHSQNRRLGTIIINDTAAANKIRQHELALLDSKERPDAVVRLVEEMFEQASQSSLTDDTVSVCRHLHLTPRERDVLQGISQELTPDQIASKLSLNVKTVSTHKLTAMRKLGFKRNGELYYWLLQGGLWLGNSTR